ncbi:MAG: hypothetical protein ACTTKO_02045 [Candidatus Limimorpha sp.]
MKKKISIALLIAFITSIMLASCGSNRTCAAYGDMRKYQKETRY